ncbi:MAG: hypothetical protein ACRYFX_22955 [Janthinobacterium lividum]
MLQKAAALEKAGNLPAAINAYDQANQAFGKTDDLDGKQKALAKLAELNERLADQYLQQAKGAQPATQPTAARPALAVAAPAAVARPAQAARSLPASAGPLVQPVAGRVAGGKPLGLFFMTRPIPAWHSLEKATWYFAPNGQVFRNPQGLNAASYAALAPGDRGVYQAGSIRWADGRTEALKMASSSANTFTWDMGTFVGMGPFTSPAQLVGRFEDGNSASGAVMVSGLVLQANGTYTGGFAGNISATSAGSTVTVGNSGDSAGRWSLSNWVLTLTDNTGHITRGVAYPIEKDDKTGQVMRFYFSNVAYQRK